MCFYLFFTFFLRVYKYQLYNWTIGSDFDFGFNSVRVFCSMLVTLLRVREKREWEYLYNWVRFVTRPFVVYSCNHFKFPSYCCAFVRKRNPDSTRLGSNVKSSRKTTTEKFKLNKMDSEAREMTNNGKSKKKRKLNRPKFNNFICFKLVKNKNIYLDWYWPHNGRKDFDLSYVFTALSLLIIIIFFLNYYYKASYSNHHFDFWLLLSDKTDRNQLLLMLLFLLIRFLINILFVFQTNCAYYLIPV